MEDNETGVNAILVTGDPVFYRVSILKGLDLPSENAIVESFKLRTSHALQQLYQPWGLERPFS